MSETLESDAVRRARLAYEQTSREMARTDLAAAEARERVQAAQKAHEEAEREAAGDVRRNNEARDALAALLAREAPP